jgi:hypothetical protein
MDRVCSKRRLITIPNGARRAFAASSLIRMAEITMAVAMMRIMGLSFNASPAARLDALR